MSMNLEQAMKAANNGEMWPRDMYDSVETAHAAYSQAFTVRASRESDGELKDYLLAHACKHRQNRGAWVNGPTQTHN